MQRSWLTFSDQFGQKTREQNDPVQEHMTHSCLYITKEVVTLQLVNLFLFDSYMFALIQNYQPNEPFVSR